ncbi:hypothetical protein DC487_11055 [Sphingobacterium corticibacter]|uniref:DUF304 domain-containing protein n=2 Tax=Sphingobacterium corticibacter TaxID=2171749 RepID=A0A2T8HJ26_9SPHI|nr:hypothetical protein DC487_11055 [Sphingobacterium corticibacter]
MNLKHFTKDGNIYKMKPQYGSSLVLIVGLFAMAILGYWLDILILTWMMAIFGVLALLAVTRKKLYIDMDSGEIQAKVGLAKPETHIPIESIQKFELYTVSNNLVKTNAMLNLYYLDRNGQEQSILVAQGFTTSVIQSIINEIEEILENDTTKR